MSKIIMIQAGKFRVLNFGFVSDWSEADASPDIRISDFLVTMLE